MMTNIKDARSSIDSANLQEFIDASSNVRTALDKGQAQYQTPEWLARAMAGILPFRGISDALDPQCASGTLLKAVNAYQSYGMELDNRFARKNDDTYDGYKTIKRITSNCVKVAELFEEVAPDIEFSCIVANPPFGLRWRQTGDKDIDATEWTWKFIKQRLADNGVGFMIANAPTLERLGIVEDPMVYLYQRFPAGGIWENCNVELGVVHYHKYDRQGPQSSGGYTLRDAPAPRVDRVWDHVPSDADIAALGVSLKLEHYRKPYVGRELVAHWERVSRIVDEERKEHPPWNIYLSKDGTLKTYLSTRKSLKLGDDEVLKLARINRCHPLTLTTERETRVLMREVVDAGHYTIEPAALVAIDNALREVASLACPILPVTDFELVAYADEEDSLLAKPGVKDVAKVEGIAITPGNRYELSTGSYKFTESFVRKKVHFKEESGETNIEDHECRLSGSDRYIQITDDDGQIHRFMDRPDPNAKWQHHESLVWQLFKEPYVPTVAEIQGEDYERNIEIMHMNEMIAGYTYFPGQLDYYARMGCKNYGLIAADVGCHAKGTLIMMADGRSKPVESILPGERLMGWDNTARRVLHLSRGRQTMARIVPIKGDPFTVNLDHILTLVQTNVHSSRSLSATNGAVRDVTVREYLGWNKEWRDNHKLFRRGIELPERDVLFSPYFMGIYLGDGSSAGDQVEISGIDKELRDATRHECKAHNWEYREHKYGNRCPGYVLKGGGPRSWLKVLNLLGATGEAKFIPDRYKRNSKSVRLQILAGLIDADGHLDRCGTFDYISQSQRLADDVAWLARSVGLAAYIKSCQKRDQNGNGGTYHRVCISGNIDIIPTRIPRKQAKPRRQRKDVLRVGFKVELLPEDDFYGFSIEGDGRFLLGDFTVTHNTGKTLGALTMISLKSPGRCLIIAPQGTMRSSGEEGDTDYQASQWVQEIRRFAPTEPVFQLFDRQDWHNILHANGGQLPNGIYISYPQAYFSNGSFEHIPSTWEDKAEEKFCKMFNLQFVDGETEFHDGVGSTSDKGIRCIAQPSLATEMATAHGEDLWDMIQIDEAHLCCNIEAQITKNLLRVQPKYRYALTATPIPNIVSNIFSLMGWLCVKDWHKGGVRNAAWPYAVDEIGRFNTTFLSTEEDLTAQQMAKAAGKRGWSRAGTKSSPVISSPARLLKLLRPTMAYISKENCNPALNPCQVIDVRVAMGKEQAKLYGYWLNRANYTPEFKSMLTIARVQSSRLRGVCASPASLSYTRGMCRSNFNPKTVTILQLIRDCLAKGEQCVVVSARVDQSDAISERLSDAGIAISRIDSTVAPELHVAEANRFKRGDARVMLMGIKCAQGHSFDRCPNLIIGSLEWSYGTLHQAKGRVWRLTSPKPVKVWCVLHQNSIEELLFDRVAVKQDAATLCLHGRRVPRDFQTMDASEILAEHIVNYDAGDGEILSETECESQWDTLRKQLVIANNPTARAEIAA